MFFFFKQKTAYELRISDWSSDVCSSDLRIHCWSRARFAAPDSLTISGNLAIGWFPAETPADPTAVGNGWVVQGAGPDNGHLLCRTDNGLRSDRKSVV